MLLQPWRGDSPHAEACSLNRQSEYNSQCCMRVTVDNIVEETVFSSLHWGGENTITSP